MKKEKREMYYGGGMKQRKPYVHGGKAHKSIQDMEKACNKMVGYNTMDMKGDK